MDSVVDLFFQLKWNSDGIIHTDCYQANGVNMWRDILPSVLHKRLMDCKQGDNIVMKFGEGVIVPNFENHNLLEIKKSQFYPHQNGNRLLKPQMGLKVQETKKMRLTTIRLM